MAAVTPNGSLMLVVSMSLATSTCSPFNSVGMAVAVSTTWSPRNTSPIASAWVLPCSSVMLAAISDWYWRMRAWYLGVSDAHPWYVKKEHRRPHSLEQYVLPGEQRGLLPRLPGVLRNFERLTELRGCCLRRARDELLRGLHVREVLGASPTSSGRLTGL